MHLVEDKTSSSEWGAHLEAMNLQPPLVIDVNILFLGCREKLLVV